MQIAKILEYVARPVYAHCDLMCGVYDPFQARVEAQSVYNAMRKYQESDDASFKQRCILIKEERAESCKQHLWVLWTDYFKPEHAEKFSNLHDLFWRAAKAAGEAKKSTELDTAQTLIDLIDEIGGIFEQTKDGYSYEPVRKNAANQAV